VGLGCHLGLKKGASCKRRGTAGKNWGFGRHCGEGRQGHQRAKHPTIVKRRGRLSGKREKWSTGSERRMRETLYLCNNQEREEYQRSLEL